MGVSLVALGSLSRNETEAIQWGRRAPTQNYSLSPVQGTNSLIQTDTSQTNPDNSITKSSFTAFQ